MEKFRDFLPEISLYGDFSVLRRASDTAFDFQGLCKDCKVGLRSGETFHNGYLFPGPLPAVQSDYEPLFVRRGGFHLFYGGLLLLYGVLYGFQ